MHNFKELNVWKEAKDFCVKVYKAISDFPSSEIYGLTSQMKRAVVSIPSNIAKGAGRTSNKNFARFVGIAIGSTFELETQLIISRELEYLDNEKYEILINELTSMQKKLVNF